MEKKRDLSVRKGVGVYLKIFSVRNFQMSDLHGS